MEVYMTQISLINFSNLNNATHYEFMDKTLERVLTNNAICTNCKTQVEAFQAAVKEEKDCMVLSTKSLATDAITQADALRDRLYLGYKRIVRAYLNFPRPEYAKAAQILNQHIIDYKINTYDPLDKETGALKSFIEDLEVLHKSHIETLGITHYIEELNKANKAVDTHADIRLNENSAKSAGAMKRARVNADNAIAELVAYVNARMLLEGEEAYADFAAFLQTKIAKLKQSVSPKRKDDDPAPQTAEVQTESV